MTVVLLDLGNTLLDDDEKPLPGAVDLLESLGGMNDSDGQPLKFGLVSDFDTSDDPAGRRAIAERYYAVLARAGIDAFFQPLARRVTLSTEVGVFKPDPRVFRAALHKFGPGNELHHTVFVTENADHVLAAPKLGMSAFQLGGSGADSGTIARLADLPPIVARLTKYAPCCKKRGEALGKHQGTASASAQLEPATKELVGKVSAARLKERMEDLVGFGTRWTLSDRGPAVTEWIRGQFLTAGYPAAAVRFQPFAVPGAAAQRNVLCGPGRESGGMVLVCAHYDSLSETPATVAPGADDNASGIAVMLEAARLLRTVPLRRGVLFAAFGGEEQGLFGSAECARVAAAEQWKVDVVINLEMIAYQAQAKPRQVVVEYDQANRHPGKMPPPGCSASRWHRSPSITRTWSCHTPTFGIAITSLSKRRATPASAYSRRRRILAITRRPTCSSPWTRSTSRRSPSSWSRRCTRSPGSHRPRTAATRRGAGLARDPRRRRARHAVQRAVYTGCGDANVKARLPARRGRDRVAVPPGRGRADHGDQSHPGR